MICFFYPDGTEIKQYDRVLIAGKDKAIVSHVFQPGTDDAKDYSCDDTGGFLMDFENGDCQLWKEGNEDIEKLLE